MIRCFALEIAYLSKHHWNSNSPVFNPSRVLRIIASKTPDTKIRSSSLFFTSDLYAMHTDTTSNWNDACAYCLENTKGKINRETIYIYIYRFVIHKKVFYSEEGSLCRGMIQCGRWSALVEKIFSFVHGYICTYISTITDGLEFLSRIVPLFRDIAYVLHGETLSHWRGAISAINVWISAEK